MLPAFPALLLLGATLTVREVTDRDYATVERDGKVLSRVEIGTWTGGKHGWSTDLSPRCDFAYVAPDRSGDGLTGGAHLVVARLSLDGRIENQRTLKASPGGLAMPRFSPDGTRVVAWGGRQLIGGRMQVLSLADGAVLASLPGYSAIWTQAGDLLVANLASQTSEHVQCHSWTRYRGAEVVERHEGCGGLVAQVPASGVVVPDFPMVTWGDAKQMPDVERTDTIDGFATFLLGSRHDAVPIFLSARKPVACGPRAVFWEHVPTGSTTEPMVPVTLGRMGKGWGFWPGADCPLPKGMETAREFDKLQECVLPDPPPNP